MNDRELLELAAKAAGIGFYGWKDGSLVTFQTETWNPLDDNGDALRLVAKLPEPVSIDITKGLTIISGWDADVHVEHKNDPLAATRRAIVIYAAEIGKAMK